MTSGSLSKSIRTEERWFTPEEFVKQELTLKDGHWRKDILCHGKTLNYLVKVMCGWMCTFCVIKTNQELRTPMSREDALNSPVLGNMHCEYLLLRLYMEDARCVVTDDPTTNDESYTSVICKPMWLDKVKTKLQDNEYKTVSEFVHDIRLIFNICHTFNRDNKSGRMGTIMEKMFEKEFNTIFKIQ
ncbi:nuclear body protein SP140-like protein [Pangasianodon hypophthalmus]|uniref:nuclear body protein SP140-like protein n=1 Tax=Pangasianodon hypophthalmus TaxID=310915 RepID=UPI0023079CBF|nr:nuclear body protein SP140-like protein [Pangasianodon hypophthalmus]